MAEVTDVDISSGVPTGGTGTVPTLSKTNALLGAVNETAPASDTASSGINGRLQRIAQRLTTGLTTALVAGTALIGKIVISDGTNDVTIKAASTAPVAADKALVVALSPNSAADVFGEYETVAAGQTDQSLGATGAAGDYLAGVLIVPAAAAAGAVSIKDGAGSSITIFAGGGTVALPTLAPIFVPLGIYSQSGAWKITTGANVSTIGIGNFT